MGGALNGSTETGGKILVKNSGALSSLTASMRTAAEAQMPGEEKPFALLVHQDDRCEVRAFVERMHVKRFGQLPILFAENAADVEMGVVSEPATLVVMHGENISPVIQDNIVEGCYRRPRTFLILVKNDPGELCQDGRPWSRAFRSKIARTFRWPTLPEREKDEFAALFRLGVARAALERNIALPSMTRSAEELISEFPWDEMTEDGEARYRVKDILVLARRCVEQADVLHENVLTPQIVRTAMEKPATIPPPPMIRAPFTVRSDY